MEFMEHTGYPWSEVCCPQLDLKHHQLWACWLWQVVVYRKAGDAPLLPSMLSVSVTKVTLGGDPAMMERALAQHVHLLIASTQIRLAIETRKFTHFWVATHTVRYRFSFWSKHTHTHTRTHKYEQTHTQYMNLRRQGALPRKEDG